MFFNNIIYENFLTLSFIINVINKLHIDLRVTALISSDTIAFSQYLNYDLKPIV